MYYTLLYCIATVLLYCIATVLLGTTPCTISDCITPHCTVLYCIGLHCSSLHLTVLYCTLYCTVSDCTAPHCTVLYCTVLYCRYRFLQVRRLRPPCWHWPVCARLGQSRVQEKGLHPCGDQGYQARLAPVETRVKKTLEIRRIGGWGVEMYWGDRSCLVGVGMNWSDWM